MRDRINRHRLLRISSLLIWAVLLNSVFGNGSVGRLQGIVSDKESGDPIPGAQVYIAALEIGTITDMDGKFIILNIPTGKYDITINMMGYVKFILRELEILPEETKQLDIQLVTSSIEMDAVCVRSGSRNRFREMRTSSKTTGYSGSEKQGTATVDSHVIETLPTREVNELCTLRAGGVKTDSEPTRIGDEEKYHSFHFIPHDDSRYRSNPGPRKEPLTAASHNDNEEYVYFLEYLQRSGSLGHVKHQDLRDRSIVRIVNHGGQPIQNALYRIETKFRRVLWEGRTFANGESVFYPHVMFEGFNQDQMYLTVLDNQGHPYHRIPLSKDLYGVNTFKYRHGYHRPRQADILFVLDTTGSMADEIMQLEDTIFAIHAQIHQRFPDFELRFGLVQYKDRGDSYRVKYDWFAHDIDHFQHILQSIECGGGKDKAEDVQAALDTALHRIDWDPEAIKMAFLIGDARPHLNYEQYFDYVDAAKEANERGIKIHTVGASGLKPAGEYIFRQIAALTYSEYVFLTYGETGESDGSGVGKVSHHTGLNFAPTNLDQAIVDLISRDLGYHSQTEWVQDIPEPKIPMQEEHYKRRLDNLWSQILDQLSAENGTTGILPPFECADDELQELADYLRGLSTITLSGSSDIQLVDRDHLDKILAEKAFQETGLAGDEKWPMELLPGDILLLGELSRTGVESMLLARAVEPDTGRIMAAARIRL